MSTAVIPEPVETPVEAPVAETVLTPAAEPVAPVVPAAPVVPQAYELSLPEHAALDASAIERTAAYARERGLSQEAASAALHLANTEVAAALDARTAAETKLIESWKADTLADPSLGKTPEERTAKVQKGIGILNRFAEAHPEQKEKLTSFLNESGLGNHPTVVKLFAWLGESASEGSLVTALVGGESRKSDVDVFYGAK